MIVGRLASDHKNELMEQTDVPRTFMVFELMEALCSASVGHRHTVEVHLPALLLEYERKYCCDGRYSRLWDPGQTSDEQIVANAQLVSCRQWT